jgi:hypothetical protein
MKYANRPSARPPVRTDDIETYGATRLKAAHE